MNKKYNTGLIIGKMYPPHRGHVYMIEQAAKQVDKLTVIVLGHSYQKLKLEDRVSWLNETFTDTNVTVHGMKNEAYDDYNDDNVWLDHDHIISAAVRKYAPEGVDALFSSETYGEELARRLHADNVVVDLGRETFPISATACREHLFNNWHFLPPAVQRHMLTRVVVVGGESTGTTTLSKDLEEYYRVQFPNVGWIPEYGREYTYVKLAALQAVNPEATMDDLVWTLEDFRIIGEEQTRLEEEYAHSDNVSPILICDTDALTTSFWEDRYCDNDSIGYPEYANGYAKRDLYIITNHEGVAFDQDGIRNSEHVRASMTVAFEDELTKRNESWVILTGTQEERLRQATKIIDNILGQKAFFPPWEI